MPTEAENLTIHSTSEQQKAAISSCIAQQLKENPGMTQEQAVAICYSMASKATGHGSKVSNGQ